MLTQLVHRKDTYRETGGHLETKEGAFIYAGKGYNFHEWEFRTMVRYNGTKKDARAEWCGKVVAGLKDKAFTWAMDLGQDKLAKEDGIEVLIAFIRKKVFPYAREEAKRLYKIGHDVEKGILVRQHGESME